MRRTFIDAIISEAEKNKDIVLLTGDLGYNLVEKFQKKFPERYFNLGILEQTMMSVASGLALENKKVFVYSIGNFASLRCLEQIQSDICNLNLDVKIISAGAGLEYGKLGSSHFATEDIACVGALKNIEVFSPSNKEEAKKVAERVFKSVTPAYIRLNKEGSSLNGSTPRGTLYKVKSGENVAIICMGRIIDEVIKAREILGKEGISLAVYSCFKLAPCNSLEKILGKYEYVFTLEEGSPVGGLGGVVNRSAMKSPEGTCKVVNIGIEKNISGLAGERDFLLKTHKIDAISLAKTIKNMLKLKQKREKYGDKER